MNDKTRAKWQQIQRRAEQALSLMIIGACAFTGQGCRSVTEAKPTPAVFASVQIHGNTPAQIGEVTEEVFREHGYEVAHARLTNLVFEKRGTRLNNLAYGSWMGDTPIWIRVKVSIVSLPEAGCRLQCHACFVGNRDSATEEERSISRLRHGPYQKLLEEVAERFRTNSSGSR